jgi:hypothetical protein
VRSFDIVAGGHKARVTLELDGQGSFAGNIVSEDFGEGHISGLVTGDHLTGSVHLDGHAARFDASIAGHAIAGRLTAGWFFSQDFTGEEAA